MHFSFLQVTETLIRRQTPQLLTEDGLGKEIELYLSEATQSLLCDPLTYWHHETRFRNLRQLASCYLGVPAGSVFSEQIFSETGAMVSDRRTLLTAEHVQQLIFLKKNFQYLQMQEGLESEI
jgi:hypothetical protein